MARFNTRIGDSIRLIGKGIKKGLQKTGKGVGKGVQKIPMKKILTIIDKYSIGLILLGSIIPAKLALDALNKIEELEKESELNENSTLEKKLFDYFLNLCIFVVLVGGVLISRLPFTDKRLSAFIGLVVVGILIIMLNIINPFTFNQTKVVQGSLTVIMYILLALVYMRFFLTLVYGAKDV